MAAATAERPGWRSTEFVITLIAQIFTAIMGALGKVDPDTATGLVGGSAAVYASGRSAVKMVASRAVAR